MDASGRPGRVGRVFCAGAILFDSLKERRLRIVRFAWRIKQAYYDPPIWVGGNRAHIKMGVVLLDHLGLVALSEFFLPACFTVLGSPATV